MTTLTNEMQQVLKLQDTYAKQLNVELETLPKGSLCCSTRGAYRYYYHSIFRNGVRRKEYISAKDGKQAQLISDLKRKRFLLSCKKVLEENVVALRACLFKYEEFDPTKISGRLAASYEGISDASNASNTSNPLSGMDWQRAPYHRAEMHEENLKHEAIGGLRVRSKSEALIAFALDLAHVPFHYEEVLELEGKKNSPPISQSFIPLREKGFIGSILA